MNDPHPHRGIREVVERTLDDVRLFADGLAFPEGPTLLPDGSLLIVEFRGGRVSRVHSDGSISPVADVGGFPSGTAIGPDGAVYVTNAGLGVRPGRIQRVDLRDGAFATVYESCGGVELISPNDLVFDETGTMWFTDHRLGTIFAADPAGGSIRLAIDGLTGPNGIGISPDGEHLYWADTITRQVLRRRIVGPGTLEEVGAVTVHSMFGGMDPDWDTLVAGMPGAQQLDSLAIQANGDVCVGTVTDPAITVVPVDGGPMVRMLLPDEFADPMPTNLCFGGDDLRTAYVTLSETGRVITCRWPVPGLRARYDRDVVI